MSKKESKETSLLDIIKGINLRDIGTYLVGKKEELQAMERGSAYSYLISEIIGAGATLMFADGTGIVAEASGALLLTDIVTRFFNYSVNVDPKKDLAYSPGIIGSFRTHV